MANSRHGVGEMVMLDVGGEEPQAWRRGFIVALL